ncbi:uncharacterized protein LOC141504008 isoform X1 [Macrotis lagotis]|uniref:uncharacterized protein LOC141504008 isoform X1 n=1 Tax=Macrotis lagotis TaxID=92651 RepID=UPI003D693480
MKKCFQFLPKTGRSQSRISPSSRRDTGPGPRDCKRNKKMGKLHRAAAAGDLWEVLRLLLQGDQGLNDGDEWNRTPLHLACVYGYPDVVTLLVEKKCHLNPRDLEGLTPLMRAIQGEQEECTSILLKHGADPKLADSFKNNTLLHYAAYGENTAIVSKLLQYDCDLEALNKDGFSPLLLAVKEDNKEMVEFFLMNGANVNAVDSNERTPLHLACVYGYPDVVTVLVEKKCHLNPRDLEGLTPLMRAIQGQEEECASILLKHGADLKLADSFNNNTLLHYAANGQNTAIVSKLLQYDCDLEALNKDGFTPLLLAVQADNKEMVEIFLKNGANVNAVDKHQRTALMIAAKRCLLDMIELLTKYNADPSCRDKRGWTVYNFAFCEATSRPLEEYRELWEKRIQLKKTSKSTLGGSTMIKEVVEEISPGDCMNSLFDSEPNDGPSTDEKLEFDTKECSTEKKKYRELIVNSVGEQATDETPNIPSEIDACSTSKICASRKSLGLEERKDSESPWDAEEEPIIEKKENVLIETDVREVIRSEETPSISPGLLTHSRSENCATGQFSTMAAFGLEEGDHSKAAWVAEEEPMEELQTHSPSENCATRQKLSWDTKEEPMEELDTHRPSENCAARQNNVKQHPNLQNFHPTIEMKDSFSKQEEMHVKKKQKSYSPEKHPNLQTIHPTVKMKDSFSKQEVMQVKKKQKSRKPEKHTFWQLIQSTTKMKDFFLRKKAEKGVKKKQKSYLPQELEFKGSSEESQESFDKSDQEQVEGEKKKHLHNEIENLEEKHGDTLTENRIICKVNELVSMERKQYGKNQNNNITGKEMPIMNISSSKESSAPGYHLLKGVAMKTLNEKDKDKVQKVTDDLDDLTQSNDISIKDYDWTSSIYNCVMFLIGRLCTDCKESINLWKIQDIINKYEQSVELQKRQCKSLEKKVMRLQEELLEIKEMKSQLEKQKVEWKRELWSLRFTLREEEESRLRREIEFKEMKKQLRTTKEQYNKEEELKELELTKMKSYLKQVEEERNDAQRQLSQEKHTRALQEKNLNNVRKEKEAAASKMMQDLTVAESCENKNYLLDEICRLKEEVDAIKVELGDKFKDKQKENVQNQGKVLESDFMLEFNDIINQLNERNEKQLELQKSYQKSFNECISFIEELMCKDGHVKAKGEVAESYENKNYLLDEICRLKEEVDAIKVELGDKFKDKQKENVQNQGKVLESDFMLEYNDIINQLNERNEKQLELQKSYQKSFNECISFIEELMCKDGHEKAKGEIKDLPLKAVASKCKQLEPKSLNHQELLISIKNAQEKYEKLKKRRRELKEEVINLKQQIEMYKVVPGQLEEFKRELKERTRQKILENLKTINRGKQHTTRT